MSVAQPEEQRSGFFGRIEETILENNPAIGYTKSRTVFLDRGYDQLTEKFEGDVFDRLTLTSIPKEDIKTAMLERIYKNIAIELELSDDNEINVRFYLHDLEVKEFGKTEPGHLALRVSYNSNGTLDYLTVYPLPRRSTKQIVEQREENKSDLPMQDSTLEEIIGKASERRGGNDRALIGAFTKEGFSCTTDIEGQQQDNKYNEDFNMLERGFRVDRSEDFITVNQRLLTPGTITSYSSTIPLNVSKDAISKLHDEGKTWRNFLDEIGIRAETT